jgi:outer membrane protein assembly factor BamB
MHAFIRHTRLCLFVLCAILASGLRAEDAKPKFQFSVFNLGVAGGTAEADTITAQIASSGWCTASAAPQAQRWNKRPETVAANEWISVVLTGFGAQANAFVFIFDGPGGSPRLVARVHYTLTWLPGGVKKWIPPLSQISEAFRINYRPLPAERAPLVNVKLGEWQGAEEKDAASVATTTASISNREAMPPLEVMLCAAMCENGLAPTWEQAEVSLQLGLRLEFKSASIRLTKKTEKVTVVRKKEAIPEDHYYGYLARLLYLMKSETGIADFALPTGGRFRILDATAERVCAAGDNGIVAFDPRNGKKLWPATLATSADWYASRSDGAGIAKIYRYSHGVASVDLARGTQKVLSTESPSTPWGYDVRDDGMAIVARGTTLFAQRNGAELWRKEQSSIISAGPSILSSLLFAGTTDGDLICMNVDDGAEKWRKNLGGELRGSLMYSDDRIIAFTKIDDSLLSLSVKDGSMVWKHTVGDVLLKAPLKLGTQWLVAGKNNRLMLLNFANGKIVAEVRWPTWLVDVLSATVDGKSVIICTDIGDRLSVLDAANLKTIREVKLPARPSGELAYASQFPVSWGATDAEADKLDLLLDEADAKPKPAILVTDGEGYLYIVRTK